MSATIRARAAGGGVGQWFFLAIALLLSAIVLRGFSRTVPGDFAAPDFPVFLWVHGGAFAACMLLFVAQPALARTGSLRLHRRLGWLGAALALAMVALGGMAVLMGLWADKVPPFYPHGLFLMRGAFGLAAFAGLVAAGVAQRRRPAWHKRLLVCASIVVIVPGLERAMPLDAFGTAWPYAVDATVDGLALLGPAADFFATGRIHPAYLWGVGTIVLSQIAVDLTASSPVSAFLLHALGTG